jgi:hypothetical protein
MLNNNTGDLANSSAHETKITTVVNATNDGKKNTSLKYQLEVIHIPTGSDLDKFNAPNPTGCNPNN